jgi:hypothetical protein
VRRFTQAMIGKAKRLGIAETVTLHQLFQRNSFFKTHKQKLVTLDRPEELFAALNEIEESYAGYRWCKSIMT